MGGIAKGLLESPGGGTLVGRSLGLLAELGLEAILVGQNPAYEALGAPVIADAPGAEGPLAGILALLRFAEAEGAPFALALACDMPFFSRALLDRLARAPAGPAILAPRREARWEPLFSRLEPARVLPLAERLAAGRSFSLQRLLDQAGAAELPLSPGERHELDDWDAPGDLLRRAAGAP